MTGPTNELPQSWTWRTVADIGSVTLGRQRSPINHSGPNMRRYVRAANITWSGWDLSDVKEMNFDPAEFRRFQLRVGDVLLNEGSGSAKEVGKPAIWSGEVDDCCFQNTLIRVRPTECSSEYLYFFFLRLAQSGGLVPETQGVNIHHIGQARVAKCRLPVPPLAEQRRIVARIEALFARTRRARADLERITPLASKHRNRALSLQIVGSEDEPCLRTVDELLTEPATNGISVRGSDEPPGTPALRLDALTVNGLDLTRIRYIDIPLRTVERLAIRHGDFFVSRGNGSLRLLAKGAFAHEPAAQIVFPDTMIRLRFRRDCIHPGWLVLAWESDNTRRQIEQKAKTTAGIWKVSQADLGSVILSVPDLGEQGVIAQHIGGQFAVTAAAVADATRALALLDRLEQSILARAFRGELVPQDPADTADERPEPATPIAPARRRRRIAA